MLMLRSRCSAGTFRKDLYYRLRTHHLHLPPLRARTGDLPLLVQSLRRQGGARARQGRRRRCRSRSIKLLNTYSFPGNVRELEALVFDAVARHQGAILSLQSFKEVHGLASRNFAAAEPPEEPPQHSWRGFLSGSPRSKRPRRR